MTRPVFDSILSGEADIFSLTARAKMTDVRPVNFEVFTEEKAALIWEVGKAMLTYLFTPGRVKVKRLAPELAGVAHGAHPIPLVYWDGMRSSWIHLKRGEVLNVEGEKDPWPQLFVILKGQGRAIIGGEEFDVEPNRVVYVPMNLVHQLRAVSDIELIWLAWMA
jgi:mannose-6-phosphate isomerase-like protein (cupin superfamily)